MTLTARPRFLIRFAVLAAMALCGVVLALSSTGTPPVGAQDGSAPAKPTGVVTTATHDSVALAWDDPGDASITHYQIFRRDRDVHDAGEFVTIEENTGSAAASYTDDTVEPEKRYVYRVKAVNQHGASTWSDFVRADTPAAPDPADLAPSGLEVSLVENRVTLTWDAPASDAASVTGYEVLRRRPNEGEAALTTLVADTGNAETGYTDDTANEPGVSYTYRVRALRDGEQSKVSNYDRIDLPEDYAQDSSGSDEPTPTAEALAPSGLTAEDAKDGGVALSWTAPAEDAGSVTGYEVLRAQGSAEVATLVADTGNTDTTYTDSGVTGDLDGYRYQVKALRGGDASQGSNVAGVLQSAHAGAIVPLADVTLISNVGQTAATGAAQVSTTQSQAQGFTTGSDSGGYTLGSVELAVSSFSGTASDITVSIYSESSSNPGTVVHTLTTPASISAAVTTFTAPSGATLAASTTYYVVISTTASGISLSRTDATAEDTGGVSGWSIADFRRFFGVSGWNISTNPIRMRVNGDAATSTNSPATGAPVITGTARVGETLTVGISGIMDEDGLSVLGELTYQWISDDSDIDGATDSTYTLVEADAGKTITVRVSFTDDNDFPESLTSAPTVTVLEMGVTEVPSTWSLIPSGLSHGDQFRLLFVSSTGRDASSESIATYNTWIQSLAAAGHADIQDYSSTFTVVGSTAAVDARDNTQTTYTSSDKGVPIYWLNGNKVADDYEDFYDGSWGVQANRKDEAGTASSDVSIRTGSDHDGTEKGSGNSSTALGKSPSTVGFPNSSISGYGPLSSPTTSAEGTNLPLYGLSGVFQVAADATPPTLESASVRPNGDRIFLYFDEDIDKSAPALLPPTSAFSVTADGVAVSVGIFLALTGNDRLALGGLSSVIYQGQDVTVTYTDSTAGNDAAALQDKAGNDAASFTTGEDDVPAVTNDSTVEPPKGTLVSNAEQTIEDAISSTIQAQSIVTGPWTGGYTLSTIQIRLGDDSTLPGVTDLIAAVKADDGSGEPGALVASLANPASLTNDALNTFTAPAGTVLAPETTYWVVVNEARSNSADRVNLRVTANDDEDEAFSGWSIGNNRLSKVSASGSWNHGATVSNLIIVSGSVIVGTTDATPPTLESASVRPNGDRIFLYFDEDIDKSAPALLPPTSAFSVTADGVAVSVGIFLALTGNDRLALGGLSSVIYQGQDVTVTYTDSTAGNDAAALQDKAGNDAASFTTGEDDVPAVTNDSTVAAAVPGAPTGLTATPNGATQIDLNWTAPADNGGEAITGYQIEYSDDGGTSWSVLVADTQSTDTMYSDTTLSGGETRHYRVSAINSIGTGAASNNPPKGRPTISGTPEVNQTLTADISGIMDVDGVPAADQFTYQWISDDGTGDSDISGATNATYKLERADLGKTIKVRVTFTDGGGGEESLTSTAVAVASPYGDVIHSALLTVGIGGFFSGYSSNTNTGDLEPANFTHNGNPAVVQVLAYSGNVLHFQTSPALGSGNYGLILDDTPIQLGAASGSPARHQVSDHGLTWTADQQVEVWLVLNNAPTGEPVITGTPVVSQTLTADISGIMDTDGRPADDQFSYQWIRSDGATDSDISGATNATYKLKAADVGKPIKVRVTFTDGGGFPETLTSDATGPVTHLTVSSDWSLVPSSLNPGDRFRLMFLTTSRNATPNDIDVYNEWVQGRAAGGHDAIREYAEAFNLLGCTEDVAARDNTGTTYTDDDKGVRIYWLNGPKVVDDYEDLYDGDWDQEAKMRTRSGTERDNPQYVWTGCGHNGTVSSGAWLGHDKPTIGLPDGPETTGGPLSSELITAKAGSLAVYALSDVFEVAVPTTEVPADWSLVPSGLQEGDQFRLLFISSSSRNAAPTSIATYNTWIQNRVAAGHTDIQGYSSTFNVVGSTAAVDARDNTGTTYTSGLSYKGVPIYWLNGNKVADDYEDFYDEGWDEEASMRTEAGTSIEAPNYVWTGSDDDGTEEFFGGSSLALGKGSVRLGAPNNNTNTDEGPLSGTQNFHNSSSYKLYGLPGVFRVVANSPATGKPVITGTPEVNQTLTADVSAIMDEDGVPAADQFSYQWIRNDGTDDSDISGATDSTYTLKAADLGKTIKVKVTFTDEGGIEETLTSEATAEVTGPVTVVPADWSLIPSGLGPGDKFRLIFLSSETRTAEATDIATYNAWVQALAANGHADIQDHSSSFRVVGSTAAVDARDNTSTTYTSSDKGVAIHWLGGDKAADDYEDFYDETWDEEASIRDESGTTVTPMFVFTGSNHDGTKTGQPLGTNVVTVGVPNSTIANDGPLSSDTSEASTGDSHLYGLSGVFRVGAIEVPADWSLVPSGLQEGDQFRLLFISSTSRNASSSEIATYNTWIQALAANGHTDIQDYSSSFRAVGSTEDMDARDNTGTTYTSSDMGVAIYWLGGNQVADDYEDFYDEDWDEEASMKNESGTGEHAETAWTGSDHDGTEMLQGDPETSRALGNSGNHWVRYGKADSASHGPLSGATADRNNNRRIYGLSGVFEVVAASNSPATGTVTISGTAQVGGVLTANLSNVTDPDGLDNVIYSYQWIADDGTTEIDIDHATGETYRPITADEDKTVKVRVSFNDDEGNPESLTSAATGSVSPWDKGELIWSALLTVGEYDTGGPIVFGFTTTTGPAGSLEPPTFTFASTDITITTLAYTSPGTNIQLNAAIADQQALGSGAFGLYLDEANWLVTNPADKPDIPIRLPLMGLSWTDGQEVEVRLTVNHPATGAPVITGTPEVGETLTAGISGVMDEDGLPVLGQLTYQWISNDGTGDSDISGATGSTFTPGGSEVGKTIKVRVSFTDNANFIETLTSDPVDPVGQDDWLWAATMTVGDATGILGYRGNPEAGALTSSPTFTHNSTSYDVEFILLNSSGQLRLGMDQDLPPDFQLHVGTDQFDKSDAIHTSGTGIYEWNSTGLSWSVGDTIPVWLAPVPSGPSVGTVTSGMITKTSAVITVTISNPGTNTQTVNLQYKRNADTAWTDVSPESTVSAAVTFTLSGLTGNTEYDVAASLDSTFDSGVKTASFTTSPTKPSKPTGVNILISGNGTIHLAWTAPSSDGGSAITGYTVQWKSGSQSFGDSSREHTTGASATTYTITGLTNGTEYTVRVIAVNAVGDSPPSDTDSSTPEGPPDAPPNVQAGSGHQQLTVSWGAPNDGGSAITEYTLQWKSGGQSFNSTRQRTIAAPSRTDTIPSLSNGTEYTVRVRATTALGDSDWSAEAKGTPREGPHVSTVRVKEPISCTVTFVTLDFVNLEAATEYQAHLRFRVQGSSSWTVLSPRGFWSSGLPSLAAGGALNGPSPAFTLPDLAYETTYEVQAALDSGFVDGLATTTFTTPNLSEVGLTPLSPGDGTLGLRMSRPTSEGRVDGYLLQWKSGDEEYDDTDTSERQADVPGPGDLEYTITGLDNGVEYTVRAMAYNDNGVGVPSDEVRGTPEAPPNSPARGAPTISGTAQVGETLTADTGGIEDDDGLADAVYSYQWLAGDADISGATGDTYTPAYDDQGKVISVRVSFIDDRDFEETLTSEPTEEVAEDPDAPTEPPNAPRTVRIVGDTNTSLTLTWDAPDGGTAVTEYRVQWLTVGEGFANARRDGREAVVGASARSHTITGLSTGEFYQVRVLAVNGAGESKGSNTAWGFPGLGEDQYRHG